MSDLSADRLREVLDYDRETGVFKWRARTSKTSNFIRVGDVAGHISEGYVAIQVDGKTYKAHRLAWLYVTGEWPPFEIDHIDGEKANNRFANLRSATRAHNMQNERRAHRDSKSGLLGVTWHKPTKKWAAKLTVNAKTIHLGYHETREGAHGAYLAAKARLHPYQTIAS